MQQNKTVENLRKIFEILDSGTENERYDVWNKVIPNLQKMTTRGPGYGQLLLKFVPYVDRDVDYVSNLVEKDLLNSHPLSFVVDYVINFEEGLIPELEKKKLINENNLLIYLEKNSASSAVFLKRVTKLYQDQELSEAQKRALNAILYREITNKVLLSLEKEEVKHISKEDVIDILNTLDEHKPTLETLGESFVKTYFTQVYLLSNSNIQKDLEVLNRIYTNLSSIPVAQLNDFQRNLRILQLTRLEFNKLEFFNEVTQNNPVLLDEMISLSDIVESERGRLTQMQKEKRKTKKINAESIDPQAPQA